MDQIDFASMSEDEIEEERKEYARLRLTYVTYV
jgi:hypothetical protein